MSYSLQACSADPRTYGTWATDETSIARGIDKEQGKKFSEIASQNALARDECGVWEPDEFRYGDAAWPAADHLEKRDGYVARFASGTACDERGVGESPPATPPTRGLEWRIRPRMAAQTWAGQGPA
ncbi:MAG: hypothetical protein U1A77_14535 [Pirellulales bacterium]